MKKFLMVTIATGVLVGALTGRQQGHFEYRVYVHEGTD